MRLPLGAVIAIAFVFIVVVTSPVTGIFSPTPVPLGTADHPVVRMLREDDWQAALRGVPAGHTVLMEFYAGRRRPCVKLNVDSKRPAAKMDGSTHTAWRVLLCCGQVS